MINNEYCLGCEYHGYSSDISRTWPASGWYSDAQRTLYEATLNIQKDLIDMCQAHPSLDTLYEAMCFKLGKALVEAHVFKKTIDSSELNAVNINYLVTWSHFSENQILNFKF